MRRMLAFVVVLVVLVAPESASACSCADDGEPDTLRGVDAAVTARLIDVEREDPGDVNNMDATFTYRILRVYKGSRRYNLREGRKLVLENTTSGSACGLPTKEGKRYGLMLRKFQGELNTTSCGVVTPRQLRRAAERSANARSSGSGCASAA